MTAMTLEPVTMLEAAPEPEIFSLSPEEIELVLAQDAARPKAPPDPCLPEDSSEGCDEEPVTETQDTRDAAGYLYW